MSVGYPSGWYPDPSGAPQQRYWDGAGWTAHVPPPAGYAPPAAPSPGYGYPPAPAPGFNGMAIASMILGLQGMFWLFGLGPLLAIIFSLIAKRQIAERGERGGPFATAGLVLGIIGVVIAIIFIV